jgi:uncharacterized protein YgiM (DUF1202 family)
MPEILPVKKFSILLTVLALLAAACGTSEPLATPSVTASSTTSPSPTVTLPVTPPPPTPTFTPVPVEGTLTVRVNVRSGPGTSYESLGQLDAGEKVQVTLQDSLGTWYQIIYPTASSSATSSPAPSSMGRAWVAAQFVTIAAGSQIPFEATPTPPGPSGKVTQRLNVRSGPGTSFDTLGLLQAGVMVSLIGKNSSSSWFQIDYPAGPGGKGWVTSQYVQTDSSASLPVIDEYGNVVTPGAAGTPSAPDLPPTPTIGPAYADGDSLSNPARSINFSASATHSFTYSSQVSLPDGDSEDWIEFTPYAPTGTVAHLYLSLICIGNDSLEVSLWQAGSLLSDWGGLACGDERKPLQLTAGQAYQVGIASTPAEGMVLVSYSLTVENNP